MRNHDSPSIGEKYLIAWRQKRTWRRVVSVLACFVVVGTISALTLPAITMNRQECQLEEHRHGPECFGEMQVLSCTADSLGIHQHTGNCFDEDGKIICHFADFLIHEHNSSCSDENGNLLCELPVIREHRHSESCYQAAETPPAIEHQHGEECYEWLKGDNLLCGQSETTGHQHDDSCHTITSTLTCPLTEEPGHIHGDECSETSQVLICSQEEGSDHQHDESCHESVVARVCNLEETSGHQHDGGCYEDTDTISCGYEETTSHQHTDACYELVQGGLICEEANDEEVTDEAAVKELEKQLICEKDEIISHIHTNSCMDSNGDIQCELLETKTHSHEAACFAAQQVLTCELPEHTHDEICTPVEGLTEEEEQQVDDVISIIEGLPAVAEIEAEYERLAEDAEGFAAYESKIVSAVQSAFEEYNALSEKQKPYVTNAESLEAYRYLLEAKPNPPSGSPDLSAEIPGGIILTVGAEPGVLPDKTILTVRKSEDVRATSLFEQVLARKNLQFATILDISLRCDGQLVEPDGTVSVTVDGLPAQNARAMVGYVEPSEQMVTWMRTNIDASGRVTFWTDHFSNYGIALLAAEDGGDVSEDDAIDFEQWVTSASVEKNPAGQGWQQVTDGNIAKDDQLRFTIEYTIPKFSLTSTQNVIEYTLPDNIELKNAASGILYNDVGQELGTYRIENGKIRIVFNKDTVDANAANGYIIHGYVRFEAKVDGIGSVDEGDVDIKFSDEVTVQLHVKDEEKADGDLSVTKKATAIDKDTGLITYEIKVTSKNGTGKEVYLNDLMTNAGLKAGSIKVNGDAVSNVQTTGSGFSVTLPKMEAGGKYIITYQAKAEIGDKTKPVETQNKVTAQSQDKNGETLFVQASVTETISYNEVVKTGQKTTDGKIKWTITVNEAEEDISGWTLRDELNGVPFTGPVTIQPAVNGQSSLTLPYTFPQGSNQTYTITYITDIEKQPGEEQAINKVFWRKPGENWENQTGHWEWISSGPFIPLDKKAGIADASSDTPDQDGNLTLPWTMTVDTAEGSLPAGWVLYDELQNGQWFTYEQMQKILGSFSGMRYELKLWLRNETGNTNQTAETPESGKTYWAFQLTFPDSLPKGQHIEVKYTSTVKAPDWEENFVNKATLDGKYEQKPSIHYNPSGVPKIQKSDANGSGDKTEHTYKEVNAPAWFLEVTIPAGYNGGPLYIDELLPDGVTLYALSWEENGESKPVSKSPGEDTLSYVETDDGSLRITIPESITKNDTKTNKSLRVMVQVKLNAELTWTQKGDGKDSAELKNRVELLNKDDKKVGKDEQTQIITRDEDDAPVRKFAPSEIKDKDSGNLIPYTVVVNPNGEDLAANSGTVILEDVIEYRPWDFSHLYNVALVPGSIHVYRRNPDGSQGTELAKTEYTQIYEEIEQETDQWNPSKYIRRLKMTLPDETPLIVKYTYLVKDIHGMSKQWPDVTNRVTLKGESGSIGSSSTTTKVQIQESEAGANLCGVTLYKVDSSNMGLGLAGAEFQLQKWDQQMQEYVTVTDSNGNASLTTRSDGLLPLEEISFNTAYRLVETKAPPGYLVNDEPYYFFIYHSDSVKYPECKPNPFEGEKRYSGEIIYRPNTQEKTAIEIQKIWQDSSGTPKDNFMGEIQVQIQQREQGETEWKDYGEPIKISYDSINHWKYTVDNLPKYAGENTYVYRVLELPLDGYSSSYENNDGIQSGTVTIINRSRSTYILPATGGPGRFPYILSGWLFIGAAVLIYSYRFRKRKEAK